LPSCSQKLWNSCRRTSTSTCCSSSSSSSCIVADASAALVGTRSSLMGGSLLSRCSGPSGTRTQCVGASVVNSFTSYLLARFFVRRALLTFLLILPLVARRSLPRAMSGLLLLGFPLLNSDPLGALGTFAALCHRPVEVDSKVLEATAATGSGTKVAEKNELRSCQPMRAPSAAHPSQEAALLRSMIDSLLCGRHGRRQLKCM